MIAKCGDSTEEKVLLLGPVDIIVSFSGNLRARQSETRNYVTKITVRQTVTYKIPKIRQYRCQSKCKNEWQHSCQ